MRKPRITDVKEWFLRRVGKTPKCWVWKGVITKWGYGAITLRKKTYRAHRLAYDLFRGPIVDGMHIDHICRVRHCVNPDHLEMVTREENWRRGFSPTAVNKRKERCIHGHLFNEENTYKRKFGRRLCRECQRNLRRRVYWAAKGVKTLPPKVITRRSADYQEPAYHSAFKGEK